MRSQSQYYEARLLCIHLSAGNFVLLKTCTFPAGDGLFLNTCREIAEEYKAAGIAFSDMIIDNT